MKKIAILFFLGWIGCSNAASMPKGSPYDHRMQSVDYNPANITVVNARLGFLTTIIFSPDEVIVGKPMTGFEDGWDVKWDANKLSISPRPAVQKQEIVNDNGDKETVQKLFEPIASEWRTNLFVSTNKKDYSMELVLLEEGSKQAPSLVINFAYPEDKRIKASQEEMERSKALQHDQDKREIAQTLENGQAPRNWNYAMRQGKDSKNIAPDFAYDDGVMTYIGFSPYKTFPGVTKYLNGQEQTVRFSVQQKGNYKVLVVHSLDENLILRHGSQVIGVVNQSFGKVITPYKNTSSTQVERVEVQK
ncbi:TrbG/VirB9 family P-type conjugative transfer protein [Pseudomonas amygdali pv. morsprunorum]|uniref:TrbG/VirB9 family P-type conjugative transfer protein n=1 Tax=Pseudomonas amygdali TaxID=47877 RepID=UPI00288DD034|nr:TrbG/VirB9 family P-type conjugative transfer protein [Pseudomonas amygdali]MDT3268698.1 TrbG/VirB9 family P-type conjugative transfer protein [Pseudomonas amygdali pv. morsprunorum]